MSERDTYNLVGGVDLLARATLAGVVRRVAIGPATKPAKRDDVIQA